MVKEGASWVHWEARLFIFDDDDGGGVSVVNGRGWLDVDVEEDGRSFSFSGGDWDGEEIEGEEKSVLISFIAWSAGLVCIGHGCPIVDR